MSKPIVGLQANLGNGNEEVFIQTHVDGVVGLDTELSRKANVTHNHTIANVTGLDERLNEVYEITNYNTLNPTTLDIPLGGSIKVRANSGITGAPWSNQPFGGVLTRTNNAQYLLVMNRATDADAGTPFIAGRAWSGGVWTGWREEVTIGLFTGHSDEYRAHSIVLASMGDTTRWVKIATITGDTVGGRSGGVLLEFSGVSDFGQALFGMDLVNFNIRHNSIVHATNTQLPTSRRLEYGHRLVGDVRELWVRRWQYCTPTTIRVKTIQQDRPVVVGLLEERSTDPGGITWVGVNSANQLVQEENDRLKDEVKTFEQRLANIESKLSDIKSE
jgi:hypothetical protein